MAHINFLEPPKFSLRQLNLKNFELNYFWMMMIAGVLLVFMFTYGFVQRARIGSLHDHLAVTLEEAKKAGGKPAAKPGAQKASILDGLYRRIVWSPILNAIANATPDTVSLQQIKGSSSSHGIKLEGVGADVLSAARYEEDLSNVPFFSKVLLLSSIEKAMGGGPAAVKTDKTEKTEERGTAGAPRSAKTQLTFEIQGWLK